MPPDAEYWTAEYDAHRCDDGLHPRGGGPSPAEVEVARTAEAVRNLLARRTHDNTCPHRPERIWCWWAYNWRTGKNDILCAGCCDCGAILAGAADAEEVP